MGTYLATCRFGHLGSPHFDCNNSNVRMELFLSDVHCRCRHAFVNEKLKFPKRIEVIAKLELSDRDTHN